MPRVTARWAFTGAELVERVAIETDAQGRLVSVERITGPVQPGLLLPGLVNAHTHLELSAARGQVPGGQGTAAWVRALSSADAAGDAAGGAREARAAGAAFVIDVSNGAETAEAIESAGLRGVVQVELLGAAEARWRPRLGSLPADRPGVRHRVTAHSPISCSRALLSAALAPGGPPPTIHCDEDPADAALLAERSGPWADFHAGLEALLPAHPWREALPRGASGVAALAGLGLLRPELGLVHLVAATPADLDAVAAAGCTVVVCPRSNLHIGGRLPDVPGMLARGIPVALGTDSLASTPSLDLLAEAATLAAAFPDVPADAWARAVTARGAALLDDPDAGWLRVGARPGLLRVDLPETAHPLAALVDGTPWPRSWLP